MSITSIEIINDRSQSFSSTIGDLSEPYLVNNIENLDPVKAEIVSNSYGGNDGVQIQSTRRDSRNIIYTLGYNPDYSQTTIAKLRQELQKIIKPKAEVKMLFHLDDARSVWTNGVVESFVAPLFGKDPDITISVIAEDPDFLNLEQTELSGNTTAVLSNNKINFTYNGDNPSGINLALAFNRSASDLILNYYNVDRNQQSSMTISGAFLSGDILTVNTSIGEKEVSLTRSGIKVSILNWLDIASSEWIYVKSGPSTFQVLTSGASIPYDLSFVERYGGL